MKLSLKRKCRRVLRERFGMADYRPGQREAVHALLSGRDVMCIFPTGAGKSLCWQLPAVVHAGLTLVVSPLIALMRDQVRQLAAKGIPAVALDSQMTSAEREAAMERIRSKAVRILFVSPERLEQGSFRRLCREMPPWLVVVDEAHCIVQWGDSFRPAYGNIGAFLQTLPAHPVLCALTATADSGMQRAIRESLGMRREKCILLPPLRKNLIYEVRTTLDGTGEILRIIRRESCKTVIFCRTRDRTERLALLLRSFGVSAEHYHAGMEKADRNAVQQRFSQGQTNVLCATTAFGMGIDLPDIRRVIHDEMPDDLTDYAQQTGRAGRDGGRAECILLLEPKHLVRRAGIYRLTTDRMQHDLLQNWLHVRKERRDLRKLLQVLLTAECIPAGIAKGLGQNVGRCGCCSACTGGALRRHIPDVTGMKPWQARAFLLAWQRDSLAEKQGCRPSTIMSGSMLNRAAKELSFPADAAVPEQLSRLTAYFCSDGMHDQAQHRIS